MRHALFCACVFCAIYRYEGDASQAALLPKPSSRTLLPQIPPHQTLIPSPNPEPETLNLKP